MKTFQTSVVEDEFSSLGYIDYSIHILVVSDGELRRKSSTRLILSMNAFIAKNDLFSKKFRCRFVAKCAKEQQKSSTHAVVGAVGSHFESLPSKFSVINDSTESLDAKQSFYTGY